MRCTTCGGAPSGNQTPTVDPNYKLAYCATCRGSRVFRSQLDGPGQARHNDPDTSKAAAAKIRTGSAKRKLLEAHAYHQGGLSDEQAAQWAGLSLTSEYATRCSELERAGFLENTERTVIGQAGMARIVRKITDAGLEAIE